MVVVAGNFTDIRRTLKTHYCLQSFNGLTPTGGLTHLDRKNLIIILVAVVVVAVVADNCCAWCVDKT